jgi:hypothetical protein
MASDAANSSLKYKYVVGPTMRGVWGMKDKQIVLSGPAGTGKAVALDTEIPTLSGWKTMGEMAAGDVVFGPDGKPIPVVWASPVMLGHKCYRVEFSDGTTVVADAEHLWSVEDLCWKYRGYDQTTRILTTDAIKRTLRFGYGERTRYAVPCCAPVEYQVSRLMIDPYVLGCWLGDGDTHSASFSCWDNELLQNILDCGHTVSQQFSGDHRYTIQGLQKRLRILGLLGNKHIPVRYLESKTKDRLALIQGLMDTDGFCCGRQGTCEFCSTNESLATGMFILLSSMGIKATLRTGRAVLNGRDYGPKYRVCFTTTAPIFRLKRKLDRLPKRCRENQYRRYIVAIHDHDSVPVRCIKVGSEDGLYLVTTSFVTTHNTRFLLERQHRIMTKYSDARGLIIRKYRSSMGQTCLKTWEKEVLREDLGTMVRWVDRDQTYYYPNGGEVAVAGMDDPTKALSSQWDWFYWNELIEGKLAEWEMLLTRLRNYKVPYQQALGDTNPGPPTHWIKQQGNKGTLKLIETTHKDNPRYWDPETNFWTAEGMDYVCGSLANLSGIRRKRMFEGKWEVAEGQVYPMFDPDIHIVKWFKPPANWPRYWVFDFGIVDPLVWQHWAENPDNGDLYLVQEIYKTYLRVADAAEWVLQAAKGHPYPRAIICDNDAENRLDLEHAFKMLTVPAYKAIHPGIQGVQARLQNSVIRRQIQKEGKDGSKDDRYNRPAIYFMEGALIAEDDELRSRHQPLSTVQEFDAYVWDVGKMDQDKYKDMPVDKFNHGMDCLRYMTGFADDLAIDMQDEDYTEHLGDEEFQSISVY